MYATYLDNQRYQIQNRTPIPDGEGGDIQTWSIEQIERQAQAHYAASIILKDLLLTTPAEYVRAIANAGAGDTITAPLRPTLYDLLANRALGFIPTKETTSANLLTSFTWIKPRLLRPPGFCKAAFATSDSSSRKWQAVRVFRKCSMHICRIKILSKDQCRFAAPALHATTAYCKKR
ncbi:MAG: hypothetical protein IPL65_07385 [Lewinellaceae bacterium]|nr:hypothetical protein [Lewinellaceae bacterium]